MIDIDYSKKGVIVLGTPRSGSHMLCDMLYNISLAKNKKLLGEIYTVRDVSVKQTLVDLEHKHKDEFIFCSLVQQWAKNLLAMDPAVFDDYIVINLRRKNKVDQYISWCVFRAQTQAGISKHSPKWNDYKDLLPWKSDLTDIERFIGEQHLDHAFKSDYVLYYEDIVQLDLKTKFIKNMYPVPYKEIVTDINLVELMLTQFTYNDK
jgi:hypothetical protein